MVEWILSYSGQQTSYYFTDQLHTKTTKDHFSFERWRIVNDGTVKATYPQQIKHGVALGFDHWFPSTYFSV